MKRIVLVLALCLLPLSLMAAERDRYGELGGKIMCTCSCNQMLLKCNHVGCQSSDTMTRELKSAVSTYKSDEDVLDWFRRNYGVTAVVAPSTHGFEGIIWVVPWVVSALLLTLVSWLIYVWWRRPQAALAGAGSFPASPQQMDDFRARARKETEL